MANITKSKKKTKAKSKARGPAETFDKARERLDKKKLKRDRATHWAHFWNVCPKCGGDMFEQKSRGVRFEVCRTCHGIYIDQAELELAAKSLEAQKLISTLKTKSKKPNTKM